MMCNRLSYSYTGVEAVLYVRMIPGTGYSSENTVVSQLLLTSRYYSSQVRTRWGGLSSVVMRKHQKTSVRRLQQYVSTANVVPGTFVTAVRTPLFSGLPCASHIFFFVLRTGGVARLESPAQNTRQPNGHHIKANIEPWHLVLL